MKSLFKLWHKEVKCWIGCNPCVFQDGQIGRWSSNAPFDFFKDEDIEIVRNSGVSDDNGEEIFEGDILKRINVKKGTASLEKSFGVIKKESETSNLIFEWNEYDEYLERFLPPKILNLKSAKHYWVVGNIYENPELLKSEVEQ